MSFCIFCFLNQKTAYDVRISAWSSDVCSSDLLCPTCCNGTRRPSEPEPLPFTLPPESPVSEAERAEGDRLVAEASASNPRAPLLWATVDEAADVLTIRRGTRVEIEVPLSLLRVYRRHDELGRAHV